MGGGQDPGDAERGKGRGGWQASPVTAQEEPMEAEADVLEDGEIQRGEVALETVEETPFAASNPFPSNTQVMQQVSEIENELVNGAIVTQVLKIMRLMTCLPNQLHFVCPSSSCTAHTTTCE